MALGVAGLVLALPLLFLLTRAAWVTVTCYYLTPMRIRRILAGQGVLGPPPRLLVGNLRDVSALVARATAGDMGSLSHDIVGRLLPHYVRWSKMYGEYMSLVDVALPARRAGGPEAAIADRSGFNRRVAGRIFVYWYGSEPRVCVTDAGMVRELLSSRHAHVTGKSWLQRQGAKHFIGRGLIMANGATWWHQRHVVAPAFMADRLRGRVGHMVECARQTVRTLREAVARGGNEVEVGAHMARLAGDIIARTEFDTSYDTGKRVFHLIEELQNLTARSSRYLWVPGSQYFPSKYRREIKRLNGELEQLLKESIQRSREIADEGRAPSSACGMGLLGMLLAEMEKKKTRSSGNGELGYDTQTIVDECKTFFFAGHETSALLLTWAIMLLATNPSWQDKARAEVASVCGDAPPTADHLPKLTVLQMVINETLRLYPPATLLPRMAFEDITLGAGELRVPKGASVWIPVLAIHHDEAVWGADAHEFRPDRFAPGRPRPWAGRFLPFASGPRNCVGQAYAMVEAKVVLAVLLASFRFGISDEYRHAPVTVLTLRPRHGVPVRLLPLTTQQQQ
ncbi:cytokinin hydroxylase-like [Panicum miliaceum]|uniref:Cytokinin hydroxylase-like n=1 Tax=Panicum miliaceum TaxID=4540 RepID=A0A3L6PQ75_PANMI|nr:cytokinin hydroxylase-like [Panicum miliaceum]